MAIEVAVRISRSGRKNNGLKQAIFIQKSELEGTLSEARTIISKQNIETPNEYRFLSSNGNLIPCSIEETLQLKEVATIICRSGNKAPPVKTEIGAESDVNQSDIVKGKNLCIPELWLASLEDRSNVCPDENNGLGEETEENGNPQLTDVRNETQCSRCPWRAFVNLIHDQSGPKNIFKLMFILLAVLFGLLASLMLTTHLIFGTLSSLTSSPEFTNLVSKLKSDNSGMEEVTNLRMKVSELELSWKYKFDQLNGKVTELEDLYLNDLALQKREMASLKSRYTETSASFVSQNDLAALNTRVDHLAEFLKLYQESDVRKEVGKVKVDEKKKMKKNKDREGA